jgi:HEPN domain-containing protein
MAQPDSLAALSIFAEAAQDLVTAGLEQALGRNFACADACNQVTEKALQAVFVTQHGHRARYNHDLTALAGELAAPEAVIAATRLLTPYHPETFHAHTAPELADDVVTADQVQACMDAARQVVRWARGIVVGDRP